MPSQEIWAPIILAALDEYLNKKPAPKPPGVPAAPLKPLLIRQAEQAGLIFPPKEYAHLKFVDFLGLFPSVVQTRRRPGQDVLVARAEDVEFLDALVKNDSSLVHQRREWTTFRQDVFKAFTTVLPNGRQYWYSKSEDEFVEGEVNTADAVFVKVPLVTFDDAMSERRSFADTLAEIGQREALYEALNHASTPLRAFGLAIKEGRLERRWHAFRVERLEPRIRSWASSIGLDWNPAWVGGVKATKQEVNIVTARETNSFLAALMQLGPEDAKRVMVPLDIVLKLMRSD